MRGDKHAIIHITTALAGSSRQITAAAAKLKVVDGKCAVLPLSDIGQTLRIEDVNHAIVETTGYESPIGIVCDREYG